MIAAPLEHVALQHCHTWKAQAACAEELVGDAPKRSRCCDSSIMHLVRAQMQHNGSHGSYRHCDFDQTCRCHLQDTGNVRNLWECMVGHHQPERNATTHSVVDRARARTAILFTIRSDISAVEQALLQRITSTSHMPVFTLYDETNAASASADHAIIKATGSGLIVSDLAPLVVAFGGGDKLDNFGGRYGNNPRHLMSQAWLAKSEDFDYAWIVESDVFIRDADQLLGRYLRSDADIIADAAQGKPAYYPWKLGSTRHAVPPPHYGVCLTAVMRTSREFARALLRTLLIEETTSHHEMFLPFVAFAWRLKWQIMDKVDAEFLVANAQAPGDARGMVPLRLLNQSCAGVRAVHPVKRMDSDPSNLKHWAWRFGIGSGCRVEP